MTLAREIEQGLTLAIHLDLNDSTITGMGFDALAKGNISCHLALFTFNDSNFNDFNYRATDCIFY